MWRISRVANGRLPLPELLPDFCGNASGDGNVSRAVVEMPLERTEERRGSTCRHDHSVGDDGSIGQEQLHRLPPELDALHGRALEHDCATFCGCGGQANTGAVRIQGAALSVARSRCRVETELGSK